MVAFQRHFRGQKSACDPSAAPCGIILPCAASPNPVSTLIEALGTHGAILVWHAAFERSRIHELADAFPGLVAGLHAACERIVDLLPITREHYYHPDMRGSWSIKAVLPTIARGDTAPERRAELREGLREYCERDTWGMVRVAQFLSGVGVT